MKKTSKKIVGGIMVVMLIATIGAVVASAHPFFSDLTDDQKQAIKDLREELIDAGATQEEIRESVKLQLEEYGIEMPTREEIIDAKIQQTEQRLKILERTKELIQENPDITNEEIREIIQEEFELEFPEDGQGMRFRRGRCGGFRGYMCGEETEQ
jgi:hypothetical protein